ncbi:hypothetical protein IC762_28910 [Bradyrhizobium genosp. L]|nr:hypothetical protein [Bradyrhizobium genosp. L]QPF83683.1 hypothetical protein IC762_28910 [Bradyrhizobium genosp. L]
MPTILGVLTMVGTLRFAHPTFIGFRQDDTGIDVATAQCCADVAAG